MDMDLSEAQAAEPQQSAPAEPVTDNTPSISKMLLVRTA